MCNSALKFLLILILITPRLAAQPILFNFDNLQIHTPLPVSTIAGGVTATLSGTGQGYSIQDANTMGFTPAGFSGSVIYPNSIYLADLLIKFDRDITDFSIMYACQELGCDDAATMKVTAYSKGSPVGSRTRTATFPGTWPVDTLSCSSLSGFDSVVVHYNSPPPTCKDFGVIFIADNMLITPLNASGVKDAQTVTAYTLSQNYPNPFNPTTTISYSIAQPGFITIKVYDILGNEIATLVNEAKSTGSYHVTFNSAKIPSGVYFYKLQAGNYSVAKKLVIVK